jgi:hypothetical protein
MKLFIASTAIALGFSVSAFAAQPATDHSQHRQHERQVTPAAPQQQPRGAAQPATRGHMQHHQGMKMEGCCCCKKDAQGEMACDEKAAAPAAQGEDLSNH